MYGTYVSAPRNIIPYNTTPHHITACTGKYAEFMHLHSCLPLNYSFLFTAGSFATTDQGTERGTGVLRFSEMNTSSWVDAETAKALYQKGKPQPLRFLHLLFVLIFTHSVVWCGLVFCRVWCGVLCCVVWCGVVLVVIHQLTLTPNTLQVVTPFSSSHFFNVRC